MERCGYCGRYMARVEFESGLDWVCSQQTAHIIADPEHWTVYVSGHVLDDGSTYTGPIDAGVLDRDELVAALNRKEDGQ